MNSNLSAPGSATLPHPIWAVLQWFGLLSTVALLAALIMIPDQGLRILWFVLVPVLPATFLVSPAIWRGSCPLATLTKLLNGVVSKKPLRMPYLGHAGTIGIVLLLVMVPARRFLFNENGMVLAITIVAVAVAALVLGAFFDSKVGFCNSICPVLPVEKLYGQGPLVEIGNPRCPTCTFCTERGCMDLNPRGSALASIGQKKDSVAWLLTPYGFFAAAFPGFVFGYFSTVDGPLASAGSVYLTVAGWMAVSFLVTAALSVVTKLRADRLIPVQGATAVGLYYWFSGPAIASEFGLAPVVGTAIQIASLVLIVVWLWKKYTNTGTLRPAA
jgi:nitrite reductase (NADH) large subunit